MIARPLLASLIVLAVPLAHAQAPAPDATAIKHTCTRPGDPPGNLGSDTQKRTWQKDASAYSECLKKFISEQKALAEPHVKAYNSAVDEYNEAVKTFNEQIQRGK